MRAVSEARSWLSEQSNSSDPFSACGLRHIAGLVRLTRLHLYGPELTGVGPPRPPASAGLTDAGLDSLRGLANLKELWLDDSAVTDAGLMHLSGLKELGTLSLKNTKVSDVGLAWLTGLSKLGRFHVTGTKVTPAGVAGVQSKLPGVKIIP